MSESSMMAMDFDDNISLKEYSQMSTGGNLFQPLGIENIYMSVLNTHMKKPFPDSFGVICLSSERWF